MELKHLLLACYNVFDPRFVWQKERYIEKLFEFYSVPVRKLVRHEKGMGGATSAAGKDDDDQEEEEEEDKMERDSGGGVKQDEDDEGEAKGKPEKIDYTQFSKRRLPQASDRQTRRMNMGQNVSLLSLEFFLEIMHFLEEDYSGARNIDQHGLFLRTKKVRGVHLTLKRSGPWLWIARPRPLSAKRLSQRRGDVARRREEDMLMLMTRRARRAVEAL